MLFLSAVALAQPAPQHPQGSTSVPANHPSMTPPPGAVTQYPVTLKPGVTDIRVTLDNQTYVSHCRTEGQMRVELPGTTFSIVGKVVVFDVVSKKFTLLNAMRTTGMNEFMLYCEQNNIRFLFGAMIRPVVQK